MKFLTSFASDAPDTLFRIYTEAKLRVLRRQIHYLLRQIDRAGLSLTFRVGHFSEYLEFLDGCIGTVEPLPPTFPSAFEHVKNSYKELRASFDQYRQYSLRAYRG